MKFQKKIILMLLILLQCTAVFAKDYKASFFHIKSDGTTMNTRSIQFAIDYINKNGGGRLVFYVGRYLTGSIHLKSNVTIQLEEGAVLLGSTNPFDYDRIGNT
ncbi:MAG: glycoside hydrolase, partial [Pedobacter sp.]|nr:glycoside hydrolase [Pedobacter sp.]